MFFLSAPPPGSRHRPQGPYTSRPAAQRGPFSSGCPPLCRGRPCSTPGWCPGPFPCKGVGPAGAVPHGAEQRRPAELLPVPQGQVDALPRPGRVLLHVAQPPRVPQGAGQRARQAEHLPLALGPQGEQPAQRVAQNPPALGLGGGAKVPLQQGQGPLGEEAQVVPGLPVNASPLRTPGAGQGVKSLPPSAWAANSTTGGSSWAKRGSFSSSPQPQSTSRGKGPSPWGTQQAQGRPSREKARSSSFHRASPPSGPTAAPCF